MYSSLPINRRGRVFLPNVQCYNKPRYGYGKGEDSQMFFLVVLGIIVYFSLNGAGLAISFLIIGGLLSLAAKVVGIKKW
jgi:hypothetical protein